MHDGDSKILDSFRLKIYGQSTFQKEKKGQSRILLQHGVLNLYRTGQSN